MTTGSTTLPDVQAGDARGILPWGQGAGHVTPNKATDPGLVYDASLADHKKYMCGVGMTAECAGGTIAGYNLNVPSITIGNVLGTQTVTRVTNVGSSSATARQAPRSAATAWQWRPPPWRSRPAKPSPSA